MKKKTNAEKRHEVCCDDYLVICKTSSSIMSSLIKCNLYTTVQIQIAIIKQTTIVRYKQENYCGKMYRSNSYANI